MVRQLPPFLPEVLLSSPCIFKSKMAAMSCSVTPNTCSREGWHFLTQHFRSKGNPAHQCSICCCCCSFAHCQSMFMLNFYLTIIHIFSFFFSGYLLPAKCKYLYFIPLWEWTWCHCVFYVRQDWNMCAVVSSRENTCTTTKKGPWNLRTAGLPAYVFVPTYKARSECVSHKARNLFAWFYTSPCMWCRMRQLGCPIAGSNQVLVRATMTYRRIARLGKFKS